MRKNICKKVATVLFALITILTVFSSVSVMVFAQTPPQAGNNVIDNANMFSESEKTSLEDKCKSIYTQYEFDILLLTVQSVGVEDAQDIAFNYYRDNGYGFGNGRNGAVFLVSADRNYAFVVCGSGQSVLRDSRLDKVEDKVLDYLRNDDYVGAYNCFVAETENYLAKDEAEKNAPEPIFNIGWFLSFTIAGVAIAFAVTLSMRYMMKTARRRSEAGNYVRRDSFRLNRQTDMFLYITRTRVRIRTQDDSSSGHSSGGGSISHSGRSGKF